MTGSVGTARDAAIALAGGRGTGRSDDAAPAWRREPLDYDAFLAHREVHRLRGELGDGTSWSLIEKTTEGPATASPYLRGNAEREHAAYTSGLLDDLAPRVRAPRLLGAHEDAEGRLHLWLEDVEDEAARPLDAAALLAAARDLGSLAGRRLDRVPALPWLFTGWISRHAQPEAVPGALRLLDAASPRTEAALGHDLGAVRALIAAQPRVREILEALPPTLCHHDAVGANLLRADGTSVLLDWESVGPGPAGADLASLLFASVRRGDASIRVVAPLWEDAVTAYLEGVAEQTDRADPGTVRRGLDAAICLRWKLAADVIASLEAGTPMRRGSAPAEAPEETFEELRGLSDLLLATAGRLLDA